MGKAITEFTTATATVLPQPVNHFEPYRMAKGLEHLGRACTAFGDLATEVVWFHFECLSAFADEVKRGGDGYMTRYIGQPVQENKAARSRGGPNDFAIVC